MLNSNEIEFNALGFEITGKESITQQHIKARLEDLKQGDD